MEKTGCKPGEVMRNGICVDTKILRRKKGNRKEAISFIKDFLINIKDSRSAKSVSDWFITITYKNGEVKRLNEQDYDGKGICRTEIANIEVNDGWDHFDFFGDIDTYGEKNRLQIK